MIVADLVLRCFDEAGALRSTERLSGVSYLEAHRAAQQRFRAHAAVEVWEGEVCLLRLERDGQGPPPQDWADQVADVLHEPLPVDPRVAVIATTGGGLVAYWNAAAERLYGWSEAEAMGRHILDLAPTGENSAMSALIDSLSKGKVWRGVLNADRKGGRTVRAFVIGFPLGAMRGDRAAMIGVSAAEAERSVLEGDADMITAELRRRFSILRPLDDPD
jgi:PAS domain S-box-containing protein